MKIKIYKKILLALFLIATMFPLFSQEDVGIEEAETKENAIMENTNEVNPLTPKVESDEKDNEVQTKKEERATYPTNFATDLTLMALYPWGFVLEIGETCEVPILRFSNSLTHNNSLKFRAALKLTPVTFESDFKATFTPIAFLQFFGGAGMGTGWSFSRFHGFAKNVDDGEGKSKKIPINGKDFFFNVRFGVTFQFDLGALIDNKWAHVVFVTDQGFKYFGAANMTSKDSWVYTDDYGENRNSWLYTAKYLIGYQMPISLAFIGVQIESEKKLYTDPPNKEAWGDNYIYSYVTPIIAFKATEYLNILIAPQFFTRKNYFWSNDTFYEKNFLDKKAPKYLEFYRIAISANFTFKH